MAAERRARILGPPGTLSLRPLPKRYDVNQQHFLGFLDQCCLLFLAQPRAYSSDQAKVNLVIDLLLREALVQVSLFLEHSSPVL